MGFHFTRKWLNTAFQSPMIEHPGVRVFNVLHREGWSLDFHYSWATTRPDGFRCYPNETFDLRTLPDFFQRPTLREAAGTVGMDDFYDQKEADARDIIEAYIDDCFNSGQTPWATFRSRSPDWSGLVWALKKDLRAIWRDWFPTADDLAWRESLTYLGPLLEMHRDSNGGFRLYLDAQHWRVRLGKSYPQGVDPKRAITDYRRFIRRVFRGHDGIKTWRISSLMASEGLGTANLMPPLREWASAFASSAGLKFECMTSTDMRGETYFAGITEADIALAIQNRTPEDAPS